MLKGMITVKDFQKATEFPRACKDERGALRVGAAVGTSADTLERVAALREAGVDVIVVDSAHGHSKGIIEMVRWIGREYPDLDIESAEGDRCDPLCMQIIRIKTITCRAREH
jgi:IMP dehydrogenase